LIPPDNQATSEEEEQGEEVPEVLVDAAGNLLLPQCPTLHHNERQDIVCEIFCLIYSYDVPILSTHGNSVQVVQRPKVSVPWLLLAKSPAEYLDLWCVPDNFIITDLFKFTKSVLD
jgi:hypothetical protein